MRISDWSSDVCSSDLSLINPPFVLDLGARSLLRWLAGRGHRVLLVDWGTPAPDERDLNEAGHVERLLLPLHARLGTPPVLGGSFPGGTTALAAACALPAAGLGMGTEERRVVTRGSVR